MAGCWIDKKIRERRIKVRRSRILLSEYLLRSGLYAGHGLQFDVQVAVLRFDAAAAAQLDTSSAAVLPFSPGTMGPPSGQPEMLIMPDMVWAALPHRERQGRGRRSFYGSR